MIEAEGLTRSYGSFTAVRDVSFTVPDGEILGLLGPNGAGKTTTLRMLTGFLPPTRGRVRVAGHDLFTEPARARREIGYLPENVPLYPEMRVSEYLAYRGRLEGMRRPAARAAIAEVVDRCLLRDVEGQIIGTLSKGYRQRVGLAAAILHGPKVLVLDEPTVGLDPKQIIAIRELIRELGAQRTLILSTHILPEVEQLCKRVLIIDRGRVVADGSPGDLRAQAAGVSRVRVVLKDSPREAAERLGALAGVAAVVPDGSALSVEGAAGEDLREAIFKTAVEQGWVLLELHEVQASLEDVFVRLTTKDQSSAAAGETSDAAPDAAAAPADDADEGQDEDQKEAQS